MDVSRMHCMIEKLSECAKAEFDKGIENIDTCEMGQVTDMLKDLAEAMYYRTLTNGMEEFEPSDLLDAVERYGDRRFYDEYRYKTVGSHRKVAGQEEDTKSRHITIRCRLITGNGKTFQKKKGCGILI